MRQLAGQLALVTGASRGIGLAVSEALLAEGAHVLLCARSPQGLKSVAAGLSDRFGERVSAHACDVSDPAAVEELFLAARERLGGLDILVNNAGVCHRGPIDELTPAQWRETIDINLNGAFFCSRAAVPLLEPRRGFIVNVASRAGINAFPGGAAYNASKFGMIGLSEAMILDLRPRGIRVSYVMPGRVNTDFGGEDPEDWHLTTEDVAAAILHALSYDERALASRIELRPYRPPQ